MVMGNKNKSMLAIKEMTCLFYDSTLEIIFNYSII